MSEDLDKLLSLLKEVKATPEELAEIHRLTAPKAIPFCPHDPHEKQRQFLNLTSTKEVFYGGAAGGGKSDALLFAFLEYADQPDYHGIIFRRTYPQLSMSGGLLERAEQWFGGTEAKWNGTEKTWTFPSGSTLRLASMQTEQDKYNFKSSEFQYIAFDELTSFTESMYRYLFSRLRKLAGSKIPLRMRAASNPGDIGHDWVKLRFVQPKFKLQSRAFVPARLEDNPSLDYDAYVESLNELDPITRKQLLAGDWDAFEGGRFKRHWFRHTFRETPEAYFVRVAGKEEEHAKDSCLRFIITDPAATVESASDPTAIVTFAVTPHKQLLILDVVRDWIPLGDIMPKVRERAQKHDVHYVGVEAVNFQWAMIHVGRSMQGMPPVRAITAQVGSRVAQKGQKGKLIRATPAIVQAEAGKIFLPTGEAWIEEFLSELILFTGDDKKDAHDDQVDCLAYGVLQMNDYQPVDKKKEDEEEEIDLRGMPSHRLVPIGRSNPYFRHRSHHRWN